MARRPGRKLKDLRRNISGLGLVLEGPVGFVVLVGLSAVILGLVILLPVRGCLVEAEYELATLRADVADAEARIAVNERLIEALREDDVIISRVARSQFDLLPEFISPTEAVIAGADGRGSVHSAGPLLSVPRSPRPIEPARWLLAMGERFERPPVRRGLLLLAAAAMLGGMFRFPPRVEHRGEPASFVSRRVRRVHREFGDLSQTR